jgi:hypothetical protein
MMIERMLFTPVCQCGSKFAPLVLDEFRTAMASNDVPGKALAVIRLYRGKIIST